MEAENLDRLPPLRILVEIIRPSGTPQSVETLLEEHSLSNIPCLRDLRGCWFFLFLLSEDWRSRHVDGEIKQPELVPIEFHVKIMPELPDFPSQPIPVRSILTIQPISILASPTRPPPPCHFRPPRLPQPRQPLSTPPFPTSRLRPVRLRPPHPDKPLLPGPRLSDYPSPHAPFPANTSRTDGPSQASPGLPAPFLFLPARHPTSALA